METTTATAKIKLRTRTARRCASELIGELPTTRAPRWRSAGRSLHSSIHTVPYHTVVYRCEDDGCPYTHTTRQLDRRRSAGPCHRRPGRRPHRAAGEGARGHQRRLLLALRRPARTARG